MKPILKLVTLKDTNKRPFFLPLMTYLLTSGLFFWLLWATAHAAGGLAVEDNRVEAAFPASVTFHLSVSSEAIIETIELEYGTTQVACGPASAKARPDFEPATQVTTSWTWDFHKSDAPPPGASLHWRWRIKDAAGNELELAEEALVFEDTGHDWQETRSDELVLFSATPDQAVNQALWAAANEALTRLESDIGARPEGLVKIYNYPSTQAMRDATLFSHDWAGGRAIPAYETILLGVNQSNLAWGQDTIVHELAHIVVHQITFNCLGGLPTWLNEGLATYIEGGLDDYQQELFDQALAEDDLASLQSLSSSFPTNDKRANLAYAQSNQMISYLIDTYGAQKMAALLAVFKAGSTYDQALQQIYSLDTQRLDNEWRLSLGLVPRDIVATAMPLPLATLVPYGAARPPAVATPEPVSTFTPEDVDPSPPTVMPTPETGYYSNPALGFSFSYPADWEAQGGDTWTTIQSETPPVWIIGQSSLMDYNETAEDYITDLYQQISDVEVAQIALDTTTTLWDGAEARVFEFAGSNTAPQARAIFLTRGRRIFLVFTVASARTFVDQAPTLEAIAASMHVEDPRPYGVSRQNALFLAGGQPRTLDPALINGSAGGVSGAIFSGLVMLDETLRVVPDLATDWEVSDDGTRYTFHLRPNATFHDGKPLTAHDIKFSWERAADPALESDTVLTYLGDIVGVKAKFRGEADQITGLEVVDDYTLRVTIDAPKVYFLAKLTYPTAFVVDEANVQNGQNAQNVQNGQNEDWDHQPNGSGPFRLHTWEDDHLIILARNDNFYLPPAKLAYIVITMYADVPMWMYENDEIDLTGVGINNIERVTDPSNPLYTDLRIGPGLCTSRLILDVTMPPFDDPLVRRAFASVIDRQKLTEVVFKGMSQPAYAILPPIMPGHSRAISAPAFDPAQALELLADSTYGSAVALPQITFTTSGLGGDLSIYHSALIDMWRTHLGVEVQVEQLEPASFHTEVRRQHGQIITSGWCADYPDPENFLDVLYHSEAQENLGHYNNPEVDALLEQARVEADVETRLALYHQVEQMIIDDTPDILLDHDQRYLLLKPYLKNYPLSPIGLALKWRVAAIDRSSLDQSSTDQSARPEPAVPEPAQESEPVDTAVAATPTPPLLATFARLTSTPTPPTATPTPAGPSALDHFQQGADYFDQENWDLAIVEFQAGIRLEPDVALSYLFLGLSYYFSDSEADEKALEPLEMYLQLAPESENREQIMALLETIRTGEALYQTPLGEMIVVPPDKGVLIVTNYTGELVILDISGQTHEIPGKDSTPEGGEATIILAAGHHIAIAHTWNGSAAGDSEFDIGAGEVLEWPLYYNP